MPFPMIVISLFEIHMVLNSFRQFTRGGKQYSWNGSQESNFFFECFVCRLNALNKGVGLSDGSPHPVDPADDPVLFVNNFVTKA